MKSIIYVELSKEINYSYQKEFVVKLKEILPDVDTFDLDNHSEPVLFNYAIDLIRKSDQCVVVFQTENEAAIGKSMILLEEILKNKDKVFLISTGENKFVDKISKQLPHFRYYSGPESIKTDAVVHFFKTLQ